MNCKPGDLAVIVKFNPAHPHITGRIVDVIEVAPTGHGFKLPDGKSHAACRAGSWVIRFHNPVNLNSIRGRASGLFAVCPDHALRPIRDAGDGVDDESHAWLPPIPTLEHA